MSGVAVFTFNTDFEFSLFIRLFVLFCFVLFCFVLFCFIMGISPSVAYCDIY